MNNNLSVILQQNRTLRSGSLVQTEGEQLKMEIVGFVPYPSDYFFDIYQDFAIGPDRIRLLRSDSSGNKKNEKFFYSPIAKKVVLSTDRKKFRVHPYLKIMDCIENSSLTNYLRLFGNTDSESKKEALINNSPLFTSDEDGNVYYEMEDNGMMFYRSEPKDQAAAVATAFVCLCSYLNPVKGVLEYILKSPEDIIPILKDEDGK